MASAERSISYSFHFDQHLGGQFSVCSDYPLVYPAKRRRRIDYIKLSGLTV